MADNKSSHLMWIAITLALLVFIFAELKVKHPNLRNSTIDKVEQVDKEPNKNTSIPDLEASRINSGNVSAWNATPSSVLADVKSMNLNSVSIPIRVNIDTTNSNDAKIDKDSETNALNIINTMISNKIKVVVEPYPFVNNGHSTETDLQPNDKALFMKNWSNSVMEIANDIKGLDVKGLYIGSNFAHVEDQSDAFDKLINDLKPIFSGKIIYRTNWWYNATWDAPTTQAFEEKKKTPFFKNVDILSIANYFEISDPDTMDPDQLKANLSNTTVYNRGQNVIGQIEDLHKATGKPIMFGELGITNNIGAMSKPHAYGYPKDSPKNDMIQSVWYQTWIESMSKYDWFDGYSIYAIGDSESEFAPNSKAIQVLKSLNKVDDSL